MCKLQCNIYFISCHSRNVLLLIVLYSKIRSNGLFILCRDVFNVFGISDFMFYKNKHKINSVADII